MAFIQRLVYGISKLPFPHVFVFLICVNKSPAANNMGRPSAPVRIPVPQSPGMVLFPMLLRSPLVAGCKCDPLCVLWNEQRYLSLSLTDSRRWGCRLAYGFFTTGFTSWSLQPAKESLQPCPESSPPQTRDVPLSTPYNMWAFRCKFPLDPTLPPIPQCGLKLEIQL